ncbi:phosphatidylethanolamine N-methyltransferase [Paracoccidioides brasiliensis Pb03]|uniref:Phosphatidylethanolamine N-methyltransferase n=1 Tax=Paracoccidioides brasiliensis (strain Pb03) TaxID=482561 RepID=CHO2_PARBP|nr:RecName: Full=Phosphatidylethanolamine N-methyltransferase; Short=PE methyltransferase; Short=PEAMT; Short=PEMT [Paracoccidioides brasiliensis Pb03]EEH18398.2 phosphatidylethanolamine N-methyltransferase [Paracoccidioides brasiliensis Pb03]
MSGPASSTGFHIHAEGLHGRNVQPSKPTSDGGVAPTALGEKARVEEDERTDSEKKTFGRTPDGTIFTVPPTRDMVSQLLSPSEPKNLSDIFVLAIISCHIFLLRFLPSSSRVAAFAIIFLFWRAAYNIGIGWLLHMQSNGRTLVCWAKKSNIFVNPSTGQNPHPVLYNLLKWELETKIPEQYSFEDAPTEYNTWLVFRRVVDLILMCDFTSYCLFAIACGGRPAGEGFIMLALRWITGMSLVLFNLWVKLDAHRVVKDFAWYWGDFFYLIDQDLTFDGVFEMAPHPMYSVGYAGYYGISLMAASYKLLFISILAHAAQFAFLVLVENPHIEKTYNAPPPRKRVAVDTDNVKPQDDDVSQDSSVINDNVYSGQAVATLEPSSMHNLLGPHNIDLYRITDSSVLLIQILFSALAILTPSTPVYQFFFVLNAALWRVWYSVGIGYILNRQSHCKMWTRHFVKYGESNQEAWQQWKGTYHLSMTMTYASFIAATWKMYSFPQDWGYGLVLLRHILGASLIALQIWTSASIYESLGEFGWFFGDFFFDQSPKLTYSGIYRYLNNPERVLGLAGVWGAVLITSTKSVIFLALLSHTLTIAFIQLVERPHMQKLYGQSLRRDAGLVRSLKRSLPPSLKQFHGSVDKILDDSIEFIEEFIEAARPKLAAGVKTFVKDTSALFQKYPARITISRLEPDLAGYDQKDYSISLEGTQSSEPAQFERASGKEGEKARSMPDRRGDKKNLMFEYGAPIKVKWTAPLNHSKKDWIGLYMVTDNTSREITRISSQGRWIGTNKASFDSLTCEQGLISSDIVINKFREDGEPKDVASGEMVFSGDKLWWTQGVFEFRYHHNGKHSVMAVSRPFEIRIGRFDDDAIYGDRYGLVRAAIESALLPVVQNCFDRDPEIAPQTVEEQYGSLVDRNGKYSRRVVFAVHQMFGIEFAPEVVRADGNVRNLAWRICNAKKVLAPYSMSRTNGATTPTAEHEG